MNSFMPTATNLPPQEQDRAVRAAGAYKGFWMNAIYQYYCSLTKLGGKFIYVVKWSMFNLGFHLMIMWGKKKFGKK